jgi:hypothetical protein
MERAIEHFINGYGFATVLVSRPDGCADLTIVRLPRWAAAGRQSVTLTFASGPGGRISVFIVSENGLARVDILEDN